MVQVPRYFGSFHLSVISHGIITTLYASNCADQLTHLPVGQKKVSESQKDQVATPENFTMMQAFEWYVPDDHQHWKRLKNALPALKKTGVDNIWIPPACKASSQSGNGYDIYDLYDLGEFAVQGQKSATTKWGTKEELLDLCRTANEVGVGLYFDAVLNHKASADQTEKCRAVEVDPNGMPALF